MSPTVLEPLPPLALSITGLTTPLTAVLGVATVQAQGSVSLTLSKRDSGAPALTPPPGPDPVPAGEQFTYHILITNTGTTTATVWLTETLPSHVSYVTCDVVSGQDGGADWGRFNQGNEVYFYTMDHLSSAFDGLPAGGAAILYVTVRTSEPLTDGLVITNPATAYRAHATQSPGITFYGSNDVTTTVQGPALSINKTATPDPVIAGQRLTYTLAVSNTGHYTLSAPYTLTVVDHLPPYTTFAEATPPATHQSGVVTWTLPYTSDLPVGQAVTMTLAVTVTEPLTHGLALVNAGYSVSSPQVVPDAVGEPLTVTVRSWPTLQIAKLSSSDPISAGQWLTYTLVVTNASSAIGPAQNLVITDVVPLNTTLIGTSLEAAVGGTQMISDGLQAGSHITWTLPSSFVLAVGASTQVSFTVLVHSPLDNGTSITNTYGVTASNALTPVSGQQVTTVSSAPDVRVSKSVQPDSVMAGQVVTYTIYLTNPGNATAYDVWVTDTLPISVTYGGFVSGPEPPYTTTPLVAWDGLVVTGTVTRTTGVTPTVVSLVFTSTVDSAAAAGTYTNVVTATYDSDLAWTTTPLVVANPDLHLSKTPHASTVPAGQPIIYTLRYTNTSSTAASGVAITDTLPLNITGGWSDTAYAGTIAAGETITWSIGALSGGISDEITLVVTTAVPLTSGTVLTNQAAIFCADGPFGETTPPVTVMVTSMPYLTLSKSDLSDPVQAGGPITYTISYSNTVAGNANATGVIITDTLPQNIVGGWATPSQDSGTIAAGETITWNVGAVDWGQGGTINLVVTTTSPLASGTVFTNSAHITCTQGAHASAQETTQIQSAPALTLTKSGPDTVSAGGPITYTLAYTNTGNADASGVVLTDTLPQNIIGGWSDTAYEGTIAAGQVITWQLGSLAGDGGNGSLMLVVTTTSPLTNSTVLINAAHITCTQGSYASAQKETQIQSAPSLTVVKTASPNPVTPGSWLSYTITVTNQSAATDWASGIVVTDTVPLSTTLVSTGFGPGTSGTVDAPSSTPGSPITWTVSGNLAPGSNAVVTFTVAVTSPLDNGAVIRNPLAGVTCTQGVGDTDGPVDVTVSSAPVLQVVKSDTPDPVPANGVLTYTITYSNTGTMVATGVWITDTLDDNVVLNGATPPPSTQVGQNVGWSLGSLSPQDGSQSIVFSVTVGALADGTVLTNAAAITCTQGQSDTTGAVTTTVQAADVAVSKSAWPTTARPDELITYTISFSNEGSLPASNVIITDSLPLSVTLVTSDTMGATFLAADGNSFGWISTTVAAGSTGVITITARVTTTSGWLNPQSGVPVVNSVVITSTAAEAILTNNQDQATVNIIPGLPATLTLTASPTLLSVDDTAILTATVTDAWGNSVYNGDNLTVTFTTTLGTVPAGPVNVFNGVAVANITSTLPGLATITGTVGSAPTVSDTAQVTFTAGAVHHFVFSNITSPQVAGTSFTVSITAQDRYSNTVTSFTGPATLTDTTHTVMPTTLTPFVNGVWTGAVTITQAYVGDVLTTTYNTAVGTSNAFTVTHNQPLTLTISPQGATVQAGYTQTYTVTGTDAYLNSWDASDEVTYTVSSGGSFPGSPPGNRVFSATTPLGTHVITATAVNGVFVTTTVVVTRGDAVSLTISPREATIPAGTTQTYTAVAADAYAHQWDATSATSFAASGGGTFIAPGNVYSATTAGTYVITGTLDSIQDSTGVTVTAGGLHHFVVGPVASPQTAGVDFTLIITASDAFGNPVTSSEALTLTDTTGTLLPATAAFGGGITATVQVSITQVTTGDVITVTAQATPTIQGVSNAFDVVANEPDMIVLSGPAYEVPICGSGALITATVRDAWNNPVADSTIITFTTSGATVNPITNTTSSGLAHTVINATSIGAKPITATAPNGISGTLAVTFTVGAPIDITLTAGATALSAGQNTVITATVRDCDDNLVDGAVDFAASMGSLSPTSGTASNGVLTTTFSATTAGTAWVTGTLEGGVDTAVVSITVNAGSPATVTVTADPSQLPPDGSSTSTITALITDAWGNPVPGRVVTFTTTAGSIDPGPVTTGLDGRASTVLTSATAEVVATVTAYCEGLTGQVLVPFRMSYLYLPLTMRNYGPDLIVESITFDPSPPVSGQTYHVTVTIRNQGAAFYQDFWVDLYLNPSQIPSVNHVWNELSQVGYGKAWLVRGGLGAGQTVILHTSDPDDPQAPSVRYSNWPPPNYAAEHNPFYVLVDSWGYSYGMVQESNEANNLLQTVVGSGIRETQAPGPPGTDQGLRPPLDMPPPTLEPEDTPTSLQRWQRLAEML